MPPSGRKAKTRARRAPATEVHEPSDAETPEAIATPSRSSRKRARASDVVEAVSRTTRRKTKDTRPAEREDTEATEANEQSEADTETAMPSEADIISHLRVADRQVNATEDFANDLLEGQENVPGYGKIAGRDWTFIIRQVEVNIGRPEAHERLVPEENGNEGGGPSSTTVIDIDLGPDRQVSRAHAAIVYDSEQLAWYIIVNGRNGLRVDNQLFKRGGRSYLRNGSVIEIAGTQMAFITTPTEDDDGPVWDVSIIKQTQKSSEEEEGDEDPQNGHPSFGHPPARSHLQDSSMYGNDFGSSQQQQQQRTHPHSQRAALQAVPGTPTRSQQSFAKSSPAANYARGVMIESTESIDYSADSAKDLKPPHSYAQLIGMAILSTHEQQMTLSNIYKFIMDHYAFYRFNTGGWQNSIRHNLSLNKAFTKIARRTDEPGKGMKWMIEPTEFDTFVQQGMKGCRRPNPMSGAQSTFGSPTSPLNTSRLGPNGVTRDDNLTPPLKSYQPTFLAATDAYTPERGSKRQSGGNMGLGINGDGPDYDYATRSTPRNGLTAIANAAGSPPALFVNEESRVGALDTPFPLRPSQRLAPPSTLKRPSDFIQFSSPAPFWKMEGLVGSTPFKPYDLSPLKTPFSGFKKAESETKKDGETDEEDAQKQESADTSEDEPKPTGSPVISSSSPPRPDSASNALEASPTLSKPATAVAKTLSQLATTTKDSSASDAGAFNTNQPSDSSLLHIGKTNATSQIQQDPASASGSSSGPDSASNGEGSYTTSTGLQHSGAYTYTNGPLNGYHDDGEDEGIDLARGFQPIGTFHQRNHLAMMAPAQASAYGR